jgi:hypothetical protein
MSLDEINFLLNQFYTVIWLYLKTVVLVTILVLIFETAREVGMKIATQIIKFFTIKL